MSAIPPARWPTSSISTPGAAPANSKGCSSVEIGRPVSCICNAREEASMTQTTLSETLKEIPKQASAPVIAQHAATLEALPFSDTRDFDDANRGFLGTIENARIANPQGRVVWTLEPYGFLAAEEAPPTGDPSLWRPPPLNMN